MTTFGRLERCPNPCCMAVQQNLRKTSTLHRAETFQATNLPILYQAKLRCWGFAPIAAIERFTSLIVSAACFLFNILLLRFFVVSFFLQTSRTITCVGKITCTFTRDDEPMAFDCGARACARLNLELYCYWFFFVLVVG